MKMKHCTLRIFNYLSIFSHKRIDSHPLKNYVRPYLSDSEFERFLRGKDQKGVILFGMYYKHSILMNWIHDFYKPDEDPYFYINSKKFNRK